MKANALLLAALLALAGCTNPSGPSLPPQTVALTPGLLPPDYFGTIPIAATASGVRFDIITGGYGVMENLTISQPPIGALVTVTLSAQVPNTVVTFSQAFNASYPVSGGSIVVAVPPATLNPGANYVLGLVPITIPSGAYLAWSGPVQALGSALVFPVPATTFNAGSNYKFAVFAQ